MAAHLARVIHQACAASLLVARLVRRQIGLERRFGIHDNALAPGQAHQQVRTHATLVAHGRRLRVEIAILQHPRKLDHAFELHLAPYAAYAGRAQCRHQPAGFRSQLPLRLEQRSHLFGQRRLRARSRALQIPHLAVDLIERFTHRAKQVRDGLLPPLQIAVGNLLRAIQSGLCKVKKRPVVALQASA